MINQSLQVIYSDHHKTNRSSDFSILEKTRGRMIKEIVGRDKKVLDIGCRNGVLTRYFIDGNKVTGVDIDSEALEKIKNKYDINTINMDLNGDWHELGKEKYDFIIMGEVLEHLYNPVKVLMKIKERLNSTGSLIGSVPNAFSIKNRIRYLAGSKKNTPLSDPTHINQFSYKELKEILANNFSDFKIIGLGRYKKLSRFFPNLVSFDLFFIAK